MRLFFCFLPIFLHLSSISLHFAAIIWLWCISRITKFIGKHCSIMTCRFRRTVRTLATEQCTRAYRYNRQKHGHIY